MIWTVLYWALLVIAIGVAAYALFWDRAGWRGRPKLRCRKCWYDLTATPGDLRVEPIVCPECGKRHASRRSMRRTRRRKRWLVIALVCWLFAYAAQVTPNVQKNGWGAAVPRVLIVASLPFLSEEQGSGLDPFVIRTAVSNTNKFDRFILDQVPPNMNGRRVFGAYTDPKSESFGWLSRRLAFTLARIESESVLTDGTTAKGSAYKGLLSSFVDNNQTYGFEYNWANQVVTIDVDISFDFGPDENPIGLVRMRRLLLQQYRVVFDDMSTPYSGSAPTMMRINGLQPRFETVEQERQFQVRKFLWDSVRPVDHAYSYRNKTQIPGTILPAGKYLGNGVAESTIIFRFSRFTGENYEHSKDDSFWKNDFQITRTVRYPISPHRTVQADSSLELKEQIEQSFTAIITVEYKQTSSRWVPVVILEPKSGSVDISDSVVFGGRLSVQSVERASSSKVQGTGYLHGLGQSWWSWSYEGYTDIPSRSNVGRTEWTRYRLDKARLRAKSRFSHSLPGELSLNQWAVRQNNKRDGHFVLVMDYTSSGNAFNFGGLWGSRVYEGKLEFNIPNWTVEEMRQFMVNGIVPDHAMPED